MVDAALEDRASAAAAADDEEPRAEEGGGTPQTESAASDAEHGSATSRRQQVSPCVCQLARPGSLGYMTRLSNMEALGGAPPTSQSPCGSVDRLDRCLAAHGRAES